MRVVSELRRRDVHRTAALYLAAAWLVMQVVDVLDSPLSLPDWFSGAVLAVLSVGFPIALIISWFYELTPEGFALDKDIDLDKTVMRDTGRRIDFVVISLLSAAVLLFAWHTWSPSDSSQDAERAQSMTEAITEPAAEAGKAIVAGRSIAVLPFLNRSAMADDTYFVDGIHDDILTQLAKISSIGRVISRTSMEQYRETTKTLPQIGQELGVATILEGGVQRAGNQVRINVQLIEAATDKHLWAETYDRQLTVENIFRVQEEIAREVARALSVTLTAQEARRLAKIPTSSLGAYRLYQLGRQEMHKRTADSPSRATEYFERAIRADPDYAQAYAGLSESYMIQHLYGGLLSRKDGLRRARPPAERAIQLDPTLAEGYVALGNVNLWNQQYAAAETNFETAIALNPSSSSARRSFGYLLTRTGRHDEGVIQYEQAARISPLDPLIYVFLGDAYRHAYRIEDARESLRHAQGLDPDNPLIYESLGDLHGLSLGRLDEAVKWYSLGLQRDPASTRLKGFLTATYLDLGDVSTARLLIEQQIDQALLGPFSIELQQSALLMYSGQYEEALEFAEEEWRRRQYRNTANLLVTLYSLAGQYQRAFEINDRLINVYEEITPHPEIKVNAQNLSWAIDRAALLKEMGEIARSQRLLNMCLEVAKTESVRPFYLFGSFPLVHVYALLGDVQNALLALRQSIDQGKRTGWWIDLLHSPITASLRNEAKFQEMIDEIRADMAAQLENVREMQRTGEMPPLPAINN